MIYGEIIMRLEWIEQEVPKGIKVTQVYAVVFNSQGEILLKVEMKNGRKTYSLAGGTPEHFDKDRVDTLKREYIEEMNTTLKDPIYYLGYQLVDEENGKPPYAQIRMTAMIDSVGDKIPDIDTGLTYDRVFAEPGKAIELLSWGDIGEKIIKKAVEIAKQRFGLDFSVQNKNIKSV